MDHRREKKKRKDRQSKKIKKKNQMTIPRFQTGV